MVVYVIFIFQPENTMLMDSLFAALEMFVCNMLRTVSEWSVGGLSVLMLSEAESDPLFAVLLKVTMVKAHGYFLEGLKPATFTFWP